MAESEVARAFYSLLRWRLDPTRDEARNVAVLLVDARGRFGGLRHAPVSSISPRLHDQGIVDDVLVGLQERFDSGLALKDLQALHGSLQRSLVVTPPKPVAVPDFEKTLTALYRAYVAPHPRGSRAPTKGAVLDRVVNALRSQGVRAKRGSYIDDFIFDVVLEGPRKTRTVLEVLSFATPRKDWTAVERDAGHFLYALSRLDVPGRAVIQPPADRNGAAESYERVRRWLEADDVPTVEPEDLLEPQQVLDLAGT
jgi:hypothetical protein